VTPGRVAQKLSDGVSRQGRGSTTRRILASESARDADVTREKRPRSVSDGDADRGASERRLGAGSARDADVTREKRPRSVSDGDADRGASERDASGARERRGVPSGAPRSETAFRGVAGAPPSLTLRVSSRA
jgi:hypothetical protein